jgi:hypothetical protein
MATRRLSYFFFGGGFGGGGGLTLAGGGGFTFAPSLMPRWLGGCGGGGFEPFLPIFYLPGFFHKFDHFYFSNINHY